MTVLSNYTFRDVGMSNYTVRDVRFLSSIIVMYSGDVISASLSRVVMGNASMLEGHTL